MLAAVGGGTGTLGASVPVSCASCMQQQQHTHSRNSSNTSGDMSSKVRPYTNI